MSRKRQLKKERQKREELGPQLLALYRRGDGDEQFLELAGRCGAELPAEAGPEIYGEVVDRLLAQALAAGDLPRLERLRGRLRAGTRARPLARLAEAVVELAAGRLAGARAGLVALGALAREEAGGEAGRAVPPRLLPALAALGSSAAGAEDQEPQAASAWRLYRWLDGLPARDFLPGPGEIAELRRILAELGEQGGGAAGDPAVRKLVGAAERSAGLLAEVADLDAALHEALGRAGGDDRLLRACEERLQRCSRPLLETFRSGPPAPLLQPLHHALRRRWRGLLERLVAAGSGGASHIALTALAPALLDLDLAGGPGEGGAELLRLGREMAKLRAAGRHRELADLLASRGRHERSPERLTLAWSLELWALGRAVEDEGPPEDPFAEDEGEEDGEGRELGERERGEPAEHAALMRIEAMAASLAGSLPRERCPEVARFLAARLVDFLAEAAFCSHVSRAASGLLQHLPDDAGLLAVGMAAGVATNDPRRRRLLAASIAARGAARPEDRKVLLRLADRITGEEPEDAVRTLGALRPLATEEIWQEILSLFAESMVEDFSMELFAGLGFAGMFGEAARGQAASDLLRDLAVYRPLLAGRCELAALEATIEVLASRRAGTGRLRRFFAEWPDLEPALVLLRLLSIAVGPDATAPLRRVLILARDQVSERLDSRWRLWLPRLPDLLRDASVGEVESLAKRLQSLAARKGIEPEGREAIERALEKLRRLARLWRGRGRGRSSPAPADPAASSGPAGPRRARRRRPRNDRQLRLEMP